MHNIRHFYYQNKDKIWKVVLIIAFLLGIIYFFDKAAISNSQEENPIIKNENISYSDESNKTYISDKSAVSGGNITKEEVEQINNTISKFLKYCKNGNTEQAYNMLSKDCKENTYTTLEQFQNKYIKSRFNPDDVYEIKSWIKDTYKISISKDLLATGDVNNNERKIEYITIVKENSEDKLNINSYIGQEEINKEAVQNNVKITAISKKIYMDYEIYDFTIENLSNKTIKIDSLETIGTMYLKDSNKNKYNAQINEILGSDLEIRPKHSFNISIKYSNKYLTGAKIKSIVFENVILDYAEYKQTENTKDYKNTCIVEIKR